MSEIPPEIKRQLDAMRKRYTDAFVGIAKCGCCLAVTIFDPHDRKAARDAAKSAADWLHDGLEVKSVSAEASRRMIVATCPHGSQDPGEPDLFATSEPAKRAGGEG